LQPGGLGPGDVLDKVLVQVDSALLAVAPEAQADQGELHAGGGNLLPVDLPLVGGHVDADGRGVAGVVVVHDAAILDKEIAVIGGYRRLTLQGIVVVAVADVPHLGRVPILLVLPAADPGDDGADLPPVDALLRVVVAVAALHSTGEDALLI